MTDIGKKVRDLTGAHTRIVWIQEQNENIDYVGVKSDHILMGFDSEDDSGVRSIASELGSYDNPLITPNGDRVLFTDHVDQTLCSIDWDGSNRKVLCEKYFAMSVWKDPESEIEWVITRPDNTKSWFSKSRPVVAFQINNPSVSKVIWDTRRVSWHWFALSPDGTHAATVAFWPTCGLLNLEKNRFSTFDKGCWTAICPDDSYRMWVFDRDHRHVKLYDKNKNRIAVIDLHTAPGINGWEIYHPRWSNHTRIISVTGPYTNGNTGPCPLEDRKNLIKCGGNNMELYIGRLNEELSEVEAWVQVTDNEKPDFYGYAWVDIEGI